MTALERTSVGGFELEDATSVNDLDEQRLRSALLPPETLLPEVPRYACRESDIMLLSRGRPIEFHDHDSAKLSDGDQICILAPGGQLVALAEVTGNSLKPNQVLGLNCN